MLNVWGSRQRTDCDGTTRRDFLKVGALGMTGLLSPDLLRARDATAGRDHWAPLSTLALAGGGLKMGQVVGESSEKAEVPKSNPLSPQDLMATIFHVLGLPMDQQYVDPSGRPLSMIDGGRPIAELV